MSRINSAQDHALAIAGPHWQRLREIFAANLPKSELLRRSVPVLITALAALAALGVVTQTLQTRQSALDTAQERLALMADITAARTQGRNPQRR